MKSRVVWVIGAMLVLLGVLMTLPPGASAASLSDLIRQRPQVFLPSQVVPGHPAVFTVRGTPGSTVHLLLSSENNGLETDAGVPLPVGEPTAEASGEIPASGVLQLSLTVSADAVLGEEQYVAAYLTLPESTTPEWLQMIDSSGRQAMNNVIAVGVEADPGGTLIIPGGDATMTGIFRTVNTLNDIGDDPRKKDLVDEGTIDRNRTIDQNLVPVIPGRNY